MYQYIKDTDCAIYTILPQDKQGQSSGGKSFTVQENGLTSTYV